MTRSRSSPRRVRATAAVAGLLALAACAGPRAERIVHEPLEFCWVVARGDLIPARVDTPEPPGPSEAERRRWIEEHYAPPPVVRESAPRDVRRVVVRERYVPEYEYDRVVVVDRRPDWTYWVPPVALGLALWHGHRHHHGHGSWSVRWGWPGCRW